MVMTDPIADFLTRIRNAQKARFDKLDIPASKMKAGLARILKEEGYIKNFKLIRDNRQGIIRIHLKYGENRENTISGMKRVSRPGCRVYVGHEEIPRVLNGLGINILSTSKGIMTDRQARRDGVGGELLCSVW
ncbi:30S ribosomal protein S8 [Desulfoferrobacter suflitae]|uniref:30S ribosomal protein S8 n=1 Tax=Desulfoferrobacter suflitae TaxID=2865782 RepID=UPI0021643279|nr:30S ribosomal protein S8 [Desulfoferrobacter suflitae]MCK8602669.1 30S ribosomal protein S8 [Desulfoferrobacter suflitae]